MSLNDELCMVRPTLIDLNLTELHYFLFIASLDKCSGSFNADDNLSTKICVSSRKKRRKCYSI